MATFSNVRPATPAKKNMETKGKKRNSKQKLLKAVTKVMSLLLSRFLKMRGEGGGGGGSGGEFLGHSLTIIK